MADKCLRCVTGMIGATKIYEGDWEQSAALFEKKIEDWNERTCHYAIHHPGFANKFKHCPMCGKKVED
ncbi:hypothetical protein AA23_17335 [Salmonella enterica subsp. enterica]|nr:hypothetical protein [Salmonella enterica subsp. enterica]ECH9419826.1 hypothetical protein [Salmonella enterica subsp. enterica]